MINKLIEFLDHAPDHLIYIPKIWNTNTLDVIKEKDSQQLINEPDYLRTFLLSIQSTQDYNKPLSFYTNEKEWLCNSVVYSLMIRASTAWRYWDDDNNLINHTGTFIRTLYLLPYLKKMGVNTLYLLPIFEYSRQNKKGDLGSVYAINSFTNLDPDLKHNTPLTIEEEFQCLVEACHLMGIRVIVDIVPRLTATDSPYILSNPEWYYWIKSDYKKDYKAPYVEGLPVSLPDNNQTLYQLYKNNNVINHIKQFVNNPGTDSKWLTCNNSLQQIEEELSISVAPAFSDYINDDQPTWYDIAFLRFYLDNPNHEYAQIYKNYPSYALFDSIKNSMYQGESINESLWEAVVNIIPFFQSMGVDGARIDMGHSLPPLLIKTMLRKAKDYDPYFMSVAEDFSQDMAAQWKENGYDMITGNGWYFLPRFKENHTINFYKECASAIMPVFASIETHDSKRIAARAYGGLQFSRLLTLMNFFMPNAVPFINSGQELYEIQPMNIGLDCSEEDQYQLPVSHPFYGKLALFDYYVMHYLNPQADGFIQDISEVAKIRTQYLHLIKNHFKNFIEEEDIIGFVFTNNKESLTVLGNFSNTNFNTIWNLAPMQFSVSIKQNNSDEQVLMFT